MKHIRYNKTEIGLGKFDFGCSQQKDGSFVLYMYDEGLNNHVEAVLNADELNLYIKFLQEHFNEGINVQS
jgi:hypothetical protein